MQKHSGIITATSVDFSLKSQPVFFLMGGVPPPCKGQCQAGHATDSAACDKASFTPVFQCFCFVAGRSGRFPCFLCEVSKEKFPCLEESLVASDNAFLCSSLK